MATGINAYSRPNGQGGVTVDIEMMLVDLITVVKAGGYQKREFDQFVKETWNAVQIEVTIPDRAKQ